MPRRYQPAARRTGRAATRCACHHRVVADASDLARLLRDLAPLLDARSYGFVELGPDDPLAAEAFAIVREEEGANAIVPMDAVQARGREVAFVAARITLTVASDLAAVGLTAAVATRLADAGIACNVVAGLHHDHLFVPWTGRATALKALDALSAF